MRSGLSIGRRGLLRGSAAAIALLGLPLSLTGRRRARAAGHGDLVPDPEGILDLPAGFTYSIIEEKGEMMDDGYRVPGRPDAMGAFAGPGGTVILMRNHENSPGDLDNGPYGPGQSPPPEAYDPLAMGGVTRVVLDGQTFARLSSNLVLVGTTRNCAGGISPWGWLSCEENVDGTHGYVFLCPTDAESVQAPRRIDGYGRCNHEAACVDPATNIAYLTEDRGDSCLYRFVPTARDKPFDGTLQALRVVGVDLYSTNGMAVNEIVDVEWVDLDDPTPDDDSLRDEAQVKGAAIFIRGEGIWFHEGAVYVCSTSGGPAAAGQIFRLIDGDAPTLELICRSEDKDVLDYPDNICVAPWGEIYMAEDGDGDNYLRVLTQDGEVFDFARNAQSESEFAGVCFSPDGKALFVNIQGDGLTFVITGPFPELPEGETTGGDETTTGGDETTGGSTDGSTGGSTGGSTDGSSGGSSGGESASGGSTGASDGGSTGASGDESATTGGSGSGGEDDDGGCGCKTDEGGAPTLTLAAAALGLAALRPREGEALAVDEPGDA